MKQNQTVLDILLFTPNYENKKRFNRLDIYLSLQCFSIKERVNPFSFCVIYCKFLNHTFYSREMDVLVA